jgi:hypothetical protein
MDQVANGDISMAANEVLATSDLGNATECNVHMEIDKPPTNAKPSGEAPSMPPERR